MTAPEPPAAAVEKGHDFEWDPPLSLTGATARWTCRNCGAAVLDHAGHVYGSALGRTCEEEHDYWAETF